MSSLKHRWKSREVKALRKKFLLTQANLASIMGVAQQRVDEWEHGRSAMSVAYSKILDTAVPILEGLLGQAGQDQNKYRRLVLQAYQVEITDRHIKRAGK